MREEAVRARRWAGFVAGVVLAMAAAAVAFGTEPVGPGPELAAALAGAGAFAAFAAAYALYRGALDGDEPALAALAAGSLALLVGNLWMIAGPAFAAGVDPRPPTYAGFALLVAVFAWLSDASATRSTVARRPVLLALALSVLAGALLFAFFHVAGRWSALVLILLAGALLIAATRLRVRLSVWAAVALLAAACDLLLAPAFPPGSLGRLVAGVSGLLAAAAMPLSLLADAGRLPGQVTELIERLEREAGLDALTGLANRRLFDRRLNQEWRRALRDRRPLSLLMIDVDHFKRLNDRHGHLVGDECLRRVASVVQSTARRAGDLAARYGGEEFALILPETDETHATAAAERVWHGVRTVQVTQPGGGPGPAVTASVGAATVRPRPGQEPVDLIRAADEALFVAKMAGRDRVATAPRS